MIMDILFVRVSMMRAESGDYLETSLIALRGGYLNLAAAMNGPRM